MLANPCLEYMPMKSYRWFVRFASLAAAVPLSADAQAISYNTGSLGVAADGVNTAGVVLDQPGAVNASGDFSSSYAGEPPNGNYTTVPFRTELNPSASSPFTIEFWARPTATDGDDAPIGNRLATGDRSGWVFFQRDGNTGWNFRMYNGIANGLAWDITGGTAVLDAWSHVVVTWDGTTPSIYVNGVFKSSTNTPPATGVYRSNVNGENFYVGALIGGASPTNGLIDEVAYYPSALTALQIENHYNTASSAQIGAYSSMVLADGALLYLQQNPPEVKLSATNPTPTFIFTGILEESTNLTDWDDLVVTSPYTPPAPVTGRRFFRSHR